MKMMAKVAHAAALTATLTIGGVALAQTRPAAPATPVESTTTLRSTTFVVEDIDRAVDFYTQLGLVKASDRVTTASETNGVLGASDLPLTADPAVGRMVIMRGSDRNGAIALLGYDKPRLPSARGNLAGLGAGDVVLVLEVPNINDVYRGLTKIGTHFHRTPYRFNEPGVDGTPVAGQRLLAFDPDGHLVEVLQFDKK